MTRTECILNLRETVANNVQHYRRQLGMNQETFSEFIGMSEHVVFLLENPQRGGTTLNTLATLANAVGITVADLVTPHEGRTRLRGRAAQQGVRQVKAPLTYDQPGWSGPLA